MIEQACEVAAVAPRRSTGADMDLAAKLAVADLAAIADFLQAYRPGVFRYLSQSGCSRDDAEDLASQALLNAARDIRRFRGDGPLQAWVFRVAHRVLLRHRRRERLISLFGSRPLAEHKENWATEDYVVVSQAVASLPPDQRAAFLLLEVEGLSVNEAAGVIGAPAGTVKSRAFYARQRLRAVLASAYPENSHE